MKLLENGKVYIKGEEIDIELYEEIMIELLTEKKDITYFIYAIQTPKIIRKAIELFGMEAVKNIMI